MPEGHDTTIKVSNIMSFVLYTQILKQSVLKPASPGITLNKSFSIIEWKTDLRAFLQNYLKLYCDYLYTRLIWLIVSGV